jgi:hypothetical protein
MLLENKELFSNNIGFKKRAEEPKKSEVDEEQLEKLARRNEREF